jgi:hypothetical protein
VDAERVELRELNAIDRTPTAIGYHSDDSVLQDRHRIFFHCRPKGGDSEAFSGNDEKEDADSVSFTSRSSVDVKSACGSKLTQNKKGSRNTLFSSWNALLQRDLEWGKTRHTDVIIPG